MYMDRKSDILYAKNTKNMKKHIKNKCIFFEYLL